MLNLVELTLDRLAQFNLVDVAENEGGLDDLAKGFQRPTDGKEPVRPGQSSLIGRIFKLLISICQRFIR